MATKMRAAYFFLKNSFHRKLAKDPFLLLPNSWAFHGAALEEKADIYFAHDLPMLPIAREVSEKTEAKLVYDAHEFWTGLSELSRLEVKTYREIESRLIHDADLAITVNSSIAERFFESYGRRPEVIMNCVDWNGKRPTHNIIREKLGLPAHMKILLYQGKFIDFRNLDLLVKSASHFSEDIALVMLGYGTLKNRLLALAKKNGSLHRKVFFLDPVPFNDLYAYTSSADVGVIPYSGVDINTRYCTPNKLFEYISAGVPIVANSLPAIRDIVERERIGIVAEIEDEDRLAATVNGIFGNGAALDTFRKNIAVVRAKYTWRLQGKKLVTLIRSL